MSPGIDWALAATRPNEPPATTKAVAAAVSRRRTRTCDGVRLRGPLASCSFASSGCGSSSAAATISWARRSATKSGRAVGTDVSRTRSAMSTNSRIRSLAPASPPLGAWPSTAAANASTSRRDSRDLIGSTSWMGSYVASTMTTIPRHRRLRRGSSEVLGQMLGQIADGAQLKLLDGSLAAVQGRRRLGDGQPLAEPHHQAVLLLRRELVQRSDQDLAGQRGHGPFLRSGGVRGLLGELVGHHLQSGPARLVVVGHQVAGDRRQPGAEVPALPAERADRAQRPEERLAREVVREADAGQPEVEVAVDAVDVVVVELSEGFGVALASQVDQRHDAVPFGIVLGSEVAAAVGRQCRSRLALTGAGHEDRQDSIAQPSQVG